MRRVGVPPSYSEESFEFREGVGVDQEEEEEEEEEASAVHKKEKKKRDQEKKERQAQPPPPPPPPPPLQQQQQQQQQHQHQHQQFRKNAEGPRAWLMKSRFRKDFEENQRKREEQAERWAKWQEEDRERAVRRRATNEILGLRSPDRAADFSRGGLVSWMHRRHLITCT